MRLNVYRLTTTIDIVGGLPRASSTSPRTSRSRWLVNAVNIINGKCLRVAAKVSRHDKKLCYPTPPMPSPIPIPLCTSSAPLPLPFPRIITQICVVYANEAWQRLHTSWTSPGRQGVPWCVCVCVRSLRVIYTAGDYVQLMHQCKLNIIEYWILMTPATPCGIRDTQYNWGRKLQSQLNA